MRDLGVSGHIRDEPKAVSWDHLPYVLIVRCEAGLFKRIYEEPRAFP